MPTDGLAHPLSLTVLLRFVLVALPPIILILVDRSSRSRTETTLSLLFLIRRVYPLPAPRRPNTAAAVAGTTRKLPWYCA